MSAVKIPFVPDPATGVLATALRLRSSSLDAPALLHRAADGLGLVAAAVAVHAF